MRHVVIRRHGPAHALKLLDCARRSLHMCALRDCAGKDHWHFCAPWRFLASVAMNKTCAKMRVDHGAKTVLCRSRKLYAEAESRSMDTNAMLREFCNAVEKRDGWRLANLFCPDGVYHDVFYGAFAGRQKIAEMVDEWFYKSATDFRWDMHDAVSDGRRLYAYYAISYKSLLPEANGA